jgi:hypothetical protein
MLGLGGASSRPGVGGRLPPASKSWLLIGSKEVLRVRLSRVAGSPPLTAFAKRREARDSRWGLAPPWEPPAASFVACTDATADWAASAVAWRLLPPPNARTRIRLGLHGSDQSQVSSEMVSGRGRGEFSCCIRIIDVAEARPVLRRKQEKHTLAHRSGSWKGRNCCCFSNWCRARWLRPRPCVLHTKTAEGSMPDQYSVSS